MTKGEDLAHIFARHAVTARYEDMSAAAIDAAGKSLLDLVGVILAAGGTEPAVASILALVRENGGTPQGSVIGFPDRVPAAWAAFANGGMAHALDFDDLTPWGAHASSSIIPAARAIAERQGGVSGRAMVEAIAVGQDLFARMRCHVDWQKDWNISTVFGVFAATAAAGRLLGLDEARMASAFGIAAMQAGGTMDVVYGLGGDLRCIYAAFSAKAAVVAVLLAEQGIAGTRSAFSGDYGFFSTYFANRCDQAKMVEGLGRDFTGASTLYKPWPAVGPSHSHIHATVQLVSAHDLAPDDIAEIRVHVGDYHEIMCAPLAERQAPATLVDAKFALPFLVAVAAVHRDVALSHFIGGGLADPAVLAVARRVLPIADPAFDWDLELPGGRVEIVTRDGRRLALTGHDVPGSPAAPLDWPALERKFAQCAAVAVAPPSAGQVSAFRDMARALADVGDVTDLLAALRPIPQAVPTGA